MSRGEWSWERCRAAAERLFAALDWRALGDVYFHDGGEQRWQSLRPRVLELGFDWARALLRRLPANGRSLWVGAGVAELPVLLAERLLRGRSLRAVNRGARECELLRDGLRAAGLAGDLAIEPVDAATAAAAADYDHLGCVSLFTDPGAFALLSAVTYGRLHPLQLDVEGFGRERGAARALAGRLFAGLRRPGWITTTTEEVAWFLEPAAAAGAATAADPEQLPAAVVGDPIGFLRVG